MSEAQYLRIVAELQELARTAPHVTQDWILTVASMDPADMRRRLIRSYDWHRHFAHSLDGIKAVRNMPGAAPDGCWSHKEVRAVVLGLIARLERGTSPMTPGVNGPADASGSDDQSDPFGEHGIDDGGPYNGLGPKGNPNV